MHTLANFTFHHKSIPHSYTTHLNHSYPLICSGCFSSSGFPDMCQPLGTFEMPLASWNSRWRNNSLGQLPRYFLHHFFHFQWHTNTPRPAPLSVGGKDGLPLYLEIYWSLQFWKDIWNTFELAIPVKTNPSKSTNNSRSICTSLYHSCTTLTEIL